MPTTNPAGYPAKGAIMPMAGHKGYGIALLIEILTGVLSGGAFAKDVPCWVLESSEPVDQSHMFIAIDVNTIMPINQFKQRIDSLINMIHLLPKAAGADKIYLPGQMEWEHREKVLAGNAINLPEDVVMSLNGLANDYNLSFEFLYS